MPHTVDFWEEAFTPPSFQSLWSRNTVDRFDIGFEATLVAQRGSQEDSCRPAKELVHLIR